MCTTAAHITADDFDAKVLSAETPTLVDFYKPLCLGCQQLAPVVDRLAHLFDEGKSTIQVYQCNDDQLMRQCKVFFVPQLILFINGKDYWIERKINTLEGIEKEVKRLIDSGRTSRP